jgi:hypothetical protein
LREEYGLRIFENRVLRRIFGPERDDELHNLYSSPNIVRVIKSKRMRWAGHVAGMEERRDIYRFRLGVPKGRDPWEDQGVGERITLRWTLGR